jgi:hypothetical protein
MERCEEVFPRLDAALDGELSPAEGRSVFDHARACAACAAEMESRRLLKEALARLVLPPPPAALRLPSLRPSAARRLPAVAAALLAATVVLFSIPAPVPELVALSSRLHDDYLDGRLDLRALGLQATPPGTSYVGQCPCPPSMGAASPLVVYRRGDVPVSLLVFESRAADLPPRAQRALGDREYYFFSIRGKKAVVCQSGALCHVWVSRLDETTLVETILATQEGRRLFGGDRLTLEGIT